MPAPVPPAHRLSSRVAQAVSPPPRSPESRPYRPLAPLSSQPPEAAREFRSRWSPAPPANPDPSRHSKNKRQAASRTPPPTRTLPPSPPRRSQQSPPQARQFARV